MALDALLEAFEALPAFQRLAGALPSPAQRQVVSGLAGSSDAVLVASLARAFSNRLFVVVTDGVPEAER
jgi:transcription-repair coupling factor (superfamily II helicase)